jgi:hypothetical protein
MSGRLFIEFDGCLSIHFDEVIVDGGEPAAIIGYVVVHLVTGSVEFGFIPLDRDERSRAVHDKASQIINAHREELGKTQDLFKRWIAIRG